MYGDVRIRLEKKDGLVIPVDAVVDTGELQYAFVVVGTGRFEPRRLKLGVRSGAVVEVLEGLDEGETVVTTANFLLDSESRLRAAIEGSSTASGCDAEFDRVKFPEKYNECRACEIQHQGMGDMVVTCKNAIPKPWR
jgi:Cu(I)/Ag(I) efflux system membrane fusion protein